MKQSSVEWLVDKVMDMIHESNHVQLSEIYQQAKSMQEEEIGDAHYDGQIEGFTGIPSKDLAKKYYNETFNNEND